MLKTEILRSYRQAPDNVKSKRNQIQILAELNGCDAEHIINILEDNGEVVPVDKEEVVPVDKEEWEVKKKKTVIPEAVKLCVHKRMEDISDEMDRLTKEMNVLKRFMGGI